MQTIAQRAYLDSDFGCLEAKKESFHLSIVTQKGAVVGQLASSLDRRPHVPIPLQPFWPA
jgi:hypothetical protein